MLEDAEDLFELIDVADFVDEECNAADVVSRQLDALRR